MALVKDYFQKTIDLKLEYGEKSIVLMQVGAFFEVYGLKDNDNSISGSNIIYFANHCGLIISEKQANLNGKKIVMSGFRDYGLEKYLKKLKAIDYTVAVYEQDEKAAGTTRSLTGIYSPGTYFNDDVEKITNNIVSVWITKCEFKNKLNNKIIFGMANIDIFTGQSSVFEYESIYDKASSIYNELERYISIFNPSEIIFISNISPNHLNNIINYVNVKTNCIHKIFLDNESCKNSKRANNCQEQVYQNTILRRIFDNNLNLQCGESLLKYETATQAYCYLLEFIIQHNPNLVKDISVPKFENCSDKLFLGNHSLKQLNILENDDSKKNKISSVEKFFNNCITPMGKRMFKSVLLYPTTDTEYLKKEYDMCEYLIKKNNTSPIRES